MRSTFLILLKKVKDIYGNYFFFNRDERKALRNLKAMASAEKAQEKITVIVDGMIGMEIFSIYFMMLLISLKHHEKCGIRLVVITRNAHRRFLKANRIYQALSDVTYVSFEDFLDERETSDAMRKYRDIVSGIRTGDDLLNVTIEGIQFGKNIYSDHIRKKLVGTIDEIDESVKSSVYEGVRDWMVAHKVFEKYSPALLLLSHSEYNTFGSLFYASLKRNIPVAVTFPYSDWRIGGRVYVSLADFVDVPRNYAHAISDDTWKRLAKGYDAEAARVTEEYLATRFAGNDDALNGDYHKHTARLDSCAIRKRLGVKESHKKVALIAAHLLWDDATASFHSLFRDYEIWIAETLKIIGHVHDVFWIVKAHPSEMHMGTNRRIADIFHEIYGDHKPENVAFLDSDSGLNTYSLIDASDAVLTVRGTITLEAACKGKLVITAGTGPCSGFGFNTEFGSKDEYEDYLRRLGDRDDALSDEQILKAKIATYGYILYKRRFSPFMDGIRSLKDFGQVYAENVWSDETLARFARQLRGGVSGDML